MYNGIKDGIADGVYIQRGYTVYSVDSGMDNGNLTFGVREKWVIPNKQLREEFIRRRINESISNGHISDGLSSKLRIKYGDNRVRDSGRVLGKELSIDKGQSQNQQRGVPQTNGDKGVQGLTESTSRKSIDVDDALADLDFDDFINSLSLEELKELMNDDTETKTIERLPTKQERRDAYIERMYKQGNLDSAVTRIVKKYPQREWEFVKNGRKIG